MTISLNDIVNPNAEKNIEFCHAEILRMDEQIQSLENLLRNVTSLLDVSDELLDYTPDASELTQGELTEMLSDRMLFTRDYLQLVQGLIQAASNI